MADAAQSSIKATIFRRTVIGIWWATLFGLVMAVDIDDDVLFALVVMLVPAILLAIFLLAVLIWMLIASTIAACRGRWRIAAYRLAVPMIGVAMAFAGGLAGDQWLIRVKGAGLEQAVADAKAGKSIANTISATDDAAYVQTDTFFDTAQGIAYDTTDRLGDMLEMDVNERPAEWLKRMPPIFACSGGARHLGGHYWRTTIDPLDCAEE